MSSDVATPPLTLPRQIVVDTDVASFVFKWHPEFGPRYAELLNGCEMTLSFMTVAEMRVGALKDSWGEKKRTLLDKYLSDFIVLYTDDSLCSMWARIRNERFRIGRPIGASDAWIAATAVSLEIPLVTNNAKDFERISGLEVVTL